MNANTKAIYATGEVEHVTASDEAVVIHRHGQPASDRHGTGGSMRLPTYRWNAAAGHEHQWGIRPQSLVAAAIAQLHVLQEKMPCKENAVAVTHLEAASAALLQRGMERKADGLLTSRKHRGNPKEQTPHPNSTGAGEALHTIRCDYNAGVKPSAAEADDTIQPGS